MRPIHPQIHLVQDDEIRRAKRFELIAYPRRLFRACETMRARFFLELLRTRERQLDLTRVQSMVDIPFNRADNNTQAGRLRPDWFRPEQSGFVADEWFRQNFREMI